MKKDSQPVKCIIRLSAESAAETGSWIELAFSRPVEET